MAEELAPERNCLPTGYINCIVGYAIVQILEQDNKDFLWITRKLEETVFLESTC